MKRGGGLERTGIKRHPERGEGLKRTELERGPGPAPDPEKVRAWMRKSQKTAHGNRRVPTPREVVEAARVRSRGKCVMCGKTERKGWPHHPHHVFPVRGPIISFPELEAEPDNIILLCPGCHDEHERAHRRVPLCKLPAATIALAEGDVARERYLADTYP